MAICELLKFALIFVEGETSLVWSLWEWVSLSYPLRNRCLRLCELLNRLIALFCNNLHANDTEHSIVCLILDVPLTYLKTYPHVTQLLNWEIVLNGNDVTFEEFIILKQINISFYCYGLTSIFRKWSSLIE